MAIFQPSQITPSVLSGIGNGTVDLENDGINVSWHINGQSGLIGYALVILSTDGFAHIATYPHGYDTTYHTGYETVSPAAYGYASDGTPQTFSTGVLHVEDFYVDTSVGSFENGKSYQLKIIQFWTDMYGLPQHIEQNSNSVFYTRSTPTVSIDTIGTGGVLASRSNKFTGNYSQAEGDALDWFEWTISLQNDSNNPFFDSGKITGAGDISCAYDGFFVGESYTVTLTIQTQNGVLATANESFSVEYAQPTTEVWAGASCVQGTDAVLVQWNSPGSIDGIATGEYSISNNKCTMQNDSSITWPSVGAFSFAAPWSMDYKCSLSGRGATLLIVTYTDDSRMIIRYGATRLYFYNIEISSVATFTGINNTDSLEISVTPSQITVSVNGTATSVSVALNQKSIASVTLNGAQVCDYASITQLDSESGTDKYFNIDWSNGIIATSEIGGIPTGFDIYRAKTGSTTLTKVAKLPVTVANQLYDYAAVSQQGKYVYYIFPFSADKDFEAFTTNVISPCWWNYTLMECQETDNKKIFTVLRAFRFRNNIETAAVSNNNNPGILQNFTPYPTIQLSPSNYKSSVLTSLIGVVTYDTIDGQPQYLDSLQTRDAIYSLSVTRNPLFLKTRKGDLIRVKISGAISMQTADATVEQMQTMTLPWIEVGSAVGVSLYSTTYVGVQEDEGQHTTPSSNVNIEALTLSSNGTYTAPAGTAYTPVYAQIPYYDGSVETV